MMSHAVYAIFERMACYDVSTNLIIYLTKKLQEGAVPSLPSSNNTL